MVNYSKGKIYKIEPICDHDEGDIYIGSTTKQYLCQRMNKHKGGYKRWKDGKETKTTSYDLFDKYGVDNFVIVLLELVNATSKDELFMREKYYITTLKCINKIIPIRFKCEKRELKNKYYEDNKDEILDKLKIYKNNNKEKISKSGEKYYVDNKEAIIDKVKQYYQNNREKVLERQRKPICCDCGAIYQYSHKSTHLKTKKHCKFIEVNNEVNI